MSLLNRGVRIGAAAVVVGLSLAGPQALGVASADSSEVDSTSVTTGLAEPSAVSGDEGSPSRAAAGRGGRGVVPSGSTGSRVRPRASADVASVRQIPAVEAARRSVRGSVSVRPVAAVADRRHSVAVTPAGFGASVPSVPDAVSGVAEVAVAVPSAAAVVADAARVPGRAQRGAAVRSEVIASTPAVFGTAPNPVQYLLESLSGNIMDSLHTFLTSASNWLATLPQGPVTDVLQGALLLVRRTLFPDGSSPSVSGYALGHEHVSGSPRGDEFLGRGQLLGVSSFGPYRPPTEIAPDFDAEKYEWYEVTEGERVLGPVLEGTDGAVMWVRENDRYVENQDGVQGMITNKTGTPIVVQSSKSTREAMAILLPNEWMPYRIQGSGTLQFYPIDTILFNPTTLPVRPQTGFADVYLEDPFTFWSEPFVRFFANGVGDGVEYAFKEGAIVNFAAQGIQIWVRRQHDGWLVPASQAYLHRYRDPNYWFTRDYAIFNIDVKSL